MKRNLMGLAGVVLTLVGALGAVEHRAVAATEMHASNLMMQDTGQMVTWTPRAMKWETGPASLPPGSKVAVLEGNPAQPGPFTLRVKVPAHYTIRPHTHPGIEHVTVIEGTLYMGHGETLDRESARRMTQGSFIAIQPGHVHYAFTRGPATIQLHGIGPWGITYVNPADDPRNAR